MNRFRTPAAAAAVLTLVLLGSACAGSDSGSLGRVSTEPPAASPTTSPPTAPAPGSPAPTPAPSAERTITVEVWFSRDGTVFPTSRTRPATPATSRLALTELAAGPSPVESAAGVDNQVPQDLAFEVSIADGIARLDLPGSFFADGSPAATRLRQAQVVYTLTQFPTVSEVSFRSGGEPTGPPVGRADYPDLLPAIVVTAPAIGERVTSPVTVAGTADVFEATVSVRILDATGAEVATTFTTATCSVGCHGDYSVAVPYRVAGEQSGLVQVYEVSAVDGSRINVVDIPVTLAPSR